MLSFLVAALASVASALFVPLSVPFDLPSNLPVILPSNVGFAINPDIPNDYAPQTVKCPKTPLIRSADDGLGAEEKAWIEIRKARAAESLAWWLTNKVDPSFNTTRKMPTVALATSGGGPRSQLTTGGIIKAFDHRDYPDLNTSSFYWAFTYQATISGSSWTLGSQAACNWAPISLIARNHWIPGLSTGLASADLVLKGNAFTLIGELLSKNLAGTPTTIVDAWGRLLSFGLLPGKSGGVKMTMSKIASQPGFVNHDVPYPLMSAVGVATFDNGFMGEPDSTNYEFGPYEFGSWDEGIRAFTPTRYLGTMTAASEPAVGNYCTENYDNLGFIMATCSNVFNEAFSSNPQIAENTKNEIVKPIADITNGLIKGVALAEFYARYPNPFYRREASPKVTKDARLFLVDTAQTGQNNPIEPLLQPAREVDVIVVSDNSADANNYPDGTSMLATYDRAMKTNLTRMPDIPAPETFVANGYNKNATFFGCNDPNLVTIIYLPNAEFTYPSNKPTTKLQYSEDQASKMIENGVGVATQGGKANWPMCLACGVMKKTEGDLPAACEACFKEYCHN